MSVAGESRSGEATGRRSGAFRRSAIGGLGLLAACAAVFGAGFATGRRSEAGRPGPAGDTYEIREGRHAYTNPLLECEIAGTGLDSAMRPFGDRLRALVETLERESGAGTLSVYFRDLNNGPWVGHQERKRHFPASLAKVPIVIACFRQAETNPGFLSRTIVNGGFEQEREPGFMNPESNLVRGEAYTVEELIRRVAKYSDNAAAKLLAGALTPGLLQRVYFDLGVDPQRLADPGFSLSPKEYGSFFRVLYNASYLTRGFSERALRYFDESTFELGLVAGVPAGTPVSHKFGVWEAAAPGDHPPFQLHDCGIVYHPRRPYLLCVMTAGDNYVRMAADIAAVSRFVHAEVDTDLKAPPPAPLDGDFIQP